MEESIKQQIVGQKIVRVTYFEINQPDETLFFDGFDCFDLGINIEFSNGFHWHIGWKADNCLEIGTGEYFAEEYDSFKQEDATHRWARFANTVVEDFKIIYVSKELKIPALCTIHFKNSESVSIILGEELNLDNSIPTPLKYTEGCEMYVFHEREPPQIEFVKIVVTEYSNEKEYPTVVSPKDQKKITRIFLASLLIILALLLLFFKMTLG